MHGHITRPRLIAKARAKYVRTRKRNPSLPPLLPAPGKIEVIKGAVRVTLPTPGGKAIVAAAPVGGWRFALEYVDHLPSALVDAKAAAAPAVVPPAATIVDQAKPNYGTLDLFAGFERQTHNISDIAAE